MKRQKCLYKQNILLHIYLLGTYIGFFFTATINHTKRFVGVCRSHQ